MELGMTGGGVDKPAPKAEQQESQDTIHADEARARIRDAIAQLSETATTLHDDLLAVWREKLAGDLRGLRQLLKGLHARLQTRDASELEPVRLRGWLRAFGDTLLPYCDTVLLPTSKDDLLYQPWLDGLQTTLEDLPEFVPVQFEPDEWRENAPRTAWTASWKSVRGVVFALRKKDKPFIRDIPLRGCLIATTEARVAALRGETRVNLLEKAAEHVELLRDASIELKQGLRLVDESDSVNPGTPLLEAIEAFQALLDRIQEEWNQLLTVQSDRFAAQLDAIVEDVRTWWPYTNTRMLPAYRWNDASRARELDKVRQKWNSRALQHERTLQGRRKEWKKDLELVQLELGAMLDVQRHLRILTQALEQDVLPKLDLLQAKTGKVAAGLGFDEDSNKPLDKQAIGTATRLLTLDIRRKHMPDLTQALVHAEIDTLPSTFATDLGALIDKLPAKQVIFAEKEDAKSVRGEMEEVELREIIRREFYNPLSRRLATVSETLRNRQGGILQNISDLDHLLEVNVTAGLDLLSGESLSASALTGAALEEEDRPEADEETQREASRVIRAGYDRLLARLEDIRSSLDSLAGDCRSELQDAATRFETQLESLSASEEILELRLRYAASVAKERMRELRRQSAHRIIAGVKWSVTGAPRLLGWLRRRYWGLKELTGLTQVSREAGTRLSAFLRETDRAINTLPFVYRQLFRITPLADERFFTGRERELGALSEQTALWRDGHLASTALVGELGSGRTSLLFIAQRSILAKQPYVEVQLPRHSLDEAELAGLLRETFKLPKKAKQLDDIEEALLEKDRPRTVCIVENLHHLYLRTINGFDLLERFMLLVSRTGETVLWILTCNLYGWSYLDKAMTISKFVQRTVELGCLTEEELRELIRKRHQASGFRSIYEAPESLKKSRKFRRLRTDEERQQAIQAAFFDRLHDLSTGNIAAAMLFYLRSITVDDEGVLHIARLSLDETFLAGMDADELFTLSALIQHGALDEEQHARVFRQNTAQSRVILSRLTGRGILVVDGAGFRIHPFLYRLATRELKANNLLS